MINKLGILFTFFSIMILPYFVCNGESRSLDANTRKEAKGEFAKFRNGIVHYEIAGRENPNPTILVHGFSIPYIIWDKTFSVIAENGFQVIRYDLYGRGYSDRPDVIYDMELFENQLYDLITEFKIVDQVNLVGVSMGGAIVVHFANKFPEKVSKVVLIDPAGFPMQTPLTAQLVKVPVIGEYITNAFGDKTLITGLSANFNKPQEHFEIKEAFENQMKFFGFKNAILSTLRNMPLESLASTYENFGKKNIPTLLFWGMEDRIIPYENHKRVISSIPHANFVAIEKGGHTPQYENPELINPVLIDFLRGH
jgi:pimeloyl-ACP methyl ester carboxylesterase